MSHDYKRQLQLVRGSSNNIQQTAKEAQTLAKAATATGALSLILKSNIFVDWPYGLAIMAAILKDFLDFTLIGSLPGIGSVITLCISILIGLMMLLARINSGQGVAFKKSLIRYLLLLFATAAELIFAVNFSPIETTVTLMIYATILAERKASENSPSQTETPPTQQQPIPQFARADDYDQAKAA